MATVGDVAIADSAPHAVVLKDAATATPALPVNLFSQQQSDIETTDLSGFIAVIGGGSFMTRDTSQAWHGVGSLKTVVDGSFAFQAVAAPVAAGSFIVGASYTFSVYIRSLTTPTVRLVVQGNQNLGGSTQLASVNVTLSPTWTRYSITLTIPANSLQTIALRVDTGSVAQAITFWMDALQVEAGSVANAWTPGSIAAGVVTLANSAMQAVAIGDMRAP